MNLSTHSHDLNVIEIASKVGYVRQRISILAEEACHRDGRSEFHVLAKNGSKLLEEEEKVG